MPTLEETVRLEQEEHERRKRGAEVPDSEPEPGTSEELAEAPVEPEEAEQGTPTDEAGNPTLIDRSQYEREDLAIAKVDGNAIDRIRIAFSGTVSLDRSEPADVALYNRLVLGREVTLMVEGRASGTGAKEATGRDGDLDVIVGQKTVTVTTVYVPAAEELESALARTKA